MIKSVENENLKWIKDKQIGSKLAKVRPEATFAEIELNNISWEPNLIFKLYLIKWRHFQVVRLKVAFLFFSVNCCMIDVTNYQGEKVWLCVQDNKREKLPRIVAYKIGESN